MITILSPTASFIKFGATPEDHCIFGVIDFPLPVVYSSDIAFQFILQGDTEGETNAIYGSTVNVGIVNNCDDAAFLLTFPNTAVRSKKAPNQILFNWGAGVPGFTTVIAVDECFRLRVELNGQTWCSNPMKRIGVNDDVCFTSVISYASDSGGFGFFDCGPVVMPGVPGEGGDGGGPPVDEDGNCIAMDVEIVNQPNITILITAEMREKYGSLPSVQIWLYDSGGVLTNMGISASFIGGYPPTAIYIDLGGPASGWVHITV